MEERKIIRKHYIFKGSVQGVGFRYRAKHAAESYRLCGYVTNLWDGSVEMEAEGYPEDIDQAVAAILRGTFIHVEDMEVRTIPVENDRSFQVR